MFSLAKQAKLFARKFISCRNTELMRLSTTPDQVRL